MNVQAMDISNTISNQINPILDNDILQNHRIQDLFKITNCNIEFDLFTQAVHKFCNFVYEDKELLSKFLKETNHIDQKLFMSNNGGKVLWDFIKFAPICNEEQIIKLIKEILNITVENTLRNEQNIELNNTVQNVNSEINTINNKLCINNDKILATKYQILEMLKHNNVKINNEEKFIQEDLEQILMKGKELIKQYNNQNNSSTKQLQQLLREYNMDVILKNKQVMNCMQEIVKIIDSSQELIMKIQTLEKEKYDLINFSYK